MEEKKAKTYVVVGIALFVIGIVGYLFYKQKNGGTNGNYNLAKINFGANGNIIGDLIKVPFNNGLNSAQFYKNDRVVFFNDKNQWLLKGSYLNGGKTIVMDNGKKITSDNVMNNLVNALK